MKIAAVIEIARRKELPPLQKRVLEYIDSHEDEVFNYRDQKLADDLQAKASALGFTLWALNKKGLIEKQEAGGKVYFGSKRAVEELRRSLGRPSEDSYERAHRNLEHIREKVGNLDAQPLLDEVREGK